jgi:plasmid stabilization system protein ParE
VALLIYSGQAVADLERFTDFLIAQDSDAALATLDLIEEALAILRRHPFIGRQVDDELYELVISRGKSGYVALYSFEEADDAVLVLAIRHQREAGYGTDNAL